VSARRKAFLCASLFARACCLLLTRCAVSFLRLSVRLLTTMCSRTTKDVPQGKHAMILHILKHSPSLGSARGSPLAAPLGGPSAGLVASRFASQQFERHINESIQDSESFVLNQHPFPFGAELKEPLNESMEVFY